MPRSDRALDLRQGVDLLASVALTIYKLISIFFFVVAMGQLGITVNSVLQARLHVTLHHSWRVVACLFLSARTSVLPHALRVFVVRPDQRGAELEQHIPDPCALSLASLVLATFLHAGLKLALAFHSLYRWAGEIPVAMFRMECIE
jgi:hypothetical protein